MDGEGAQAKGRGRHLPCFPATMSLSPSGLCIHHSPRVYEEQRPSHAPTYSATWPQYSFIRALTSVIAVSLKTEEIWKVDNASVPSSLFSEGLKLKQFDQVSVLYLRAAVITDL